MIRVLLVDDHAWVREALLFLLERLDDVMVVGECADGAEVADAVITLRPDVVVMDVHMPTVSGLEATRRLKDAGSTTRVIITGSLASGQVTRQAVAAGAAGVVPKGTAPELLIQTIRSVAADTTT